MEYKINSKEMLCRLYAIMCVADDEYSRPEHEILEIIMKDYGLNYEKVNELYNDLRHDYSHDYDRALDETLNSITDNGNPFIKTTKSGLLNLFSSLTSYWFTTKKSLLFKFLKSISFT